MRSYQHHIGDFNNATRHLTRIERSIYRDLIELYYDTEHQLPADIAWICRKIVANDCSTDVERMLNEFFIETPDGWYHDRCELEIERFRSVNSQKAVAGRASAQKRAEKRQQALNGKSTPVERPLNARATSGLNQEPETINQEPDNKTLAVASAPAVPAVSKTKVAFDYQTGIWSGLQQNHALITSWQEAYPGVDMRAEFNKMRTWLLSNPKNRKTNLERFINSWLSKAQDRASRPTYKTHAERTQDFKDQQAAKAFAPLLDMTEAERREWGFE